MTQHNLNTGFNYAYDRGNAQFIEAVHAEDLKFSLDEKFIISEWPESLDKYAQWTHRFHEGMTRALLRFESGGLALTELRDTNLVVQMVHHDRQQLNAFRKEFLSHLDIVEEGDPDTVEVRFWMMGGNGPRNHGRPIKVPAWVEIDTNYDTKTTQMLDDLMHMKTWDAQVGKLILWRGEPGLGKTFALRTLLHEWKNWCEYDYIADPEIFFGQSAEYLLQVLLHQSTEWIETIGDEYESKKSEKWRLIILEDAGELLGKDARKETGQALSRLLNTVDGMLGQGLKVILLVTTNESLGKLHDAVQRPGRCAINHEFMEFDQDEGVHWMESNGHGDKAHLVNGSMSLAELYAITHGVEVKAGEKIGFA